jgi:hypothetical protein
MRHTKLLVFVQLETLTSFTYTAIVESESHTYLRHTLLKLVYIPSTMSPPVIWNFHESAFSSRITSPWKWCSAHSEQCLVFGRVKNIHKNPVAERAISEVTLALATSNMNTRIRHSGLSSWEAWTKRDQLTGEPLPVDDRELIIQQHLSHLHNHLSSSKTKAHGRTKMSISDLHPGIIWCKAGV